MGSLNRNTGSWSSRTCTDVPLKHYNGICHLLHSHRWVSQFFSCLRLVCFDNRYQWLVDDIPDHMGVLGLLGMNFKSTFLVPGFPSCLPEILFGVCHWKPLWPRRSLWLFSLGESRNRATYVCTYFKKSPMAEGTYVITATNEFF